ncbi:MAG: class I SAM-dependent methyltransferase [Pegethrix bostrychoides GSE-TBD4-15B]|uniref:Class I SAM-dependent methyltransferase n=1 Tax=Pegethrix bostrychoides GSE-TBD4-15B TaxID=2839662 RepID=A0A951PDV6_9CYAN|nr:class I SAM-dependent methyltransferase [Pegethrix bostrychoides GSE-TBD4-15B]
MATQQDTQSDTLFERFLAPMFNLLIDREALRRYYESRDWEADSEQLRQPSLAYPAYYDQNFHGIQGGYLSVNAAITYDPVTQYLLPPHEDWVRRGLIERVRCQPRRVLDLGCGTGSTTLLLKKSFPQAEVIGLDLSPYMLLVAADKAAEAGLDIQVKHGNAEQTGFPDASFDLVTASLLFHETPPLVACNILQEAFRLLKPGGEVLILDGNQATLRQSDWLTQIFEEPYMKDYAAGDLNNWMSTAGFGNVATHEVWWVNQVTRGVKPLPYRKVEFSRPDALGDRVWAGARA